MKSHPAADAPRLTEAFIAVASGNHPKAKRDPGIGPTRHDVRQLRGFREDCEGLPTGALAMEKHVGYRICMIPGTEPVELLSLYNSIKSHAGTWPFHEEQVKERGERLFFFARNMLDDLGEIEDAFEDGSLDLRHMVNMLRGVHERAQAETKHALDAARGLLGFSEHIQTTLNPAIEEKIAISEGTEHDTTNHMQRAKLKRTLEQINELEKAYRRTLDLDEGNLFGRRVGRTVYGEDAVAAHDAVFDKLYAYKKSLGEVAIPFRVPKSLGNRRVQLGYAMLAARSGGQALQHLHLMWEATTAALGEALEAFEAAKDDAGRKAVMKSLEPLLAAWGTIESLQEVHEDVIR